MESNASMSINCNVKVLGIDRKGNVTQYLEKHNKATVVMVEGLLRFLQGHFSDTIYNETKGGGTPQDAITYLPVRLSFGNVGVKVRNESQFDNKPMFLQVDTTDFVEPTFDSSTLQDELPEMGSQIPVLKFSDMEISSFEDTNNSESLRIVAQIDPGALVGRWEGEEYKPYSRSFYNPDTGRWTTMLTEIGLYSSYGSMLARVLLDGEVSRKECRNEEGTLLGYSYEFKRPNDTSNPIVQDEFTTIVVEWRVGLVSIGDKDRFVTQNSISMDTFISKLSEWNSSQIKAGVEPTTDEIKEEIRSLLGEQGILSLSNIDTSSL